MIPKAIHYCWFGRNPKPESVLKCIDSWKKYCPDYEIIEWNESNFDIAANRYCREAYEAKKWAFATDYARLWIVYRYGGIYLDTDVEVVRPLEPLLRHRCFIGRQPGFQVNTGSGFGAEAGHPLIARMLADYERIPFVLENGQLDLWTCPHRNSQWLLNNGMELEDTYQEIAGAAIYPVEYFSPLDAYTRKLRRTENTYSIHHCDATWNPDETDLEKKRRYWKYRYLEARDWIAHIPNRLIRSVLGDKMYNAIKERLKGRLT